MGCGWLGQRIASHLSGLNYWVATTNTSAEKTELMKQKGYNAFRVIFSSDRLRGLAERPLLLTLMASLHAWRGGTLPERREELYADTVDLLLDWWEQPKVVRDAGGNIIVRHPSLAEFLKIERQKVRRLLEELAFQAHAAQPELTGTADILESSLISGLMHLSNDPDIKHAQLVEYLSSRAGLLIPRGVGVYTFPHRTFQEYLTACYLTDHDYPERIAELACSDFNRWREVALLAGAKAARGTASAIWTLADALCYTPVKPGCAEAQLWGAHLAGMALAETADVLHPSPRNQGKIDLVKTGLVQVLSQERLPAIERARAGDLHRPADRMEKSDRAEKVQNGFRIPKKAEVVKGRLG